MKYKQLTIKIDGAWQIKHGNQTVNMVQHNVVIVVDTDWLQ